MFVFRRDIETKNFKAIAGMPVPVKYTGLSSRRSIAQKYGHDIIMEVTQKNMSEFKSMFGSNGRSDTEKVTQLSALCDEQAKKIEALEKELKSLRAKPAAARAVQPVSAE